MTGLLIKSAEITRNSGGIPRSRLYGDLYFSAQGAAGECAHVFLGGIGAPEIWNAKKRFALGELGFGTGLNFLYTWKLWRKTATPGAILDYVAIEGHPLTRQDLAAILEPYLDLDPLRERLLAEYPPPIAGFHHLHFDQGRVRLTLAFGPVDKMIAGLRGSFNAWYLDGFSPAKNPDMWSDALMGELANLSATGARLATYTVAAKVQHALTAHGFETEIREGFGHKKQCLRAHTRGPGAALPSLGPGARIAVIGSGIAGLTAAYALKRRGFKPMLVDQNPLSASAASGNPAALIDPKFTLGNDAYCRFQLLSFYHCLRFYDQLSAEKENVWHGREGILKLATTTSEADRILKIAALFGAMEDGPDLIAGQALAEKLGLRGAETALWKPGGYVSPAAIAQALNFEGLERHTAKITSLQRDRDGWRLLNENRRKICGAEAVILANGLGAARLAPEASLPMRASRGQISYLAPLPGHKPLGLPITFGGYLTPPIEVPDQGAMHVLGATFDNLTDYEGDHWQAFSKSGHEDCLAALARVQAEEVALWSKAEISGRVGLRATTPDFLPALGPVTAEKLVQPQNPKPDMGSEWITGETAGLFIMAGLGSLGFQSAPFMAEILAAQIAGAPLPADEGCRAILDPARFCWRQKRREGYASS